MLHSKKMNMFSETKLKTISRAHIGGGRGISPRGGASNFVTGG